MAMKCDLCEAADLRQVLDLGRQPLANKYPLADQFETEARFPLKVMFCENCRNVQLSEKVSRELMFEDYFYLSSVNDGLVRHFVDLAGKIKDSRFVVDVGSNDGILLAPLKSLGVKCLGVEPSVNASQIANDAGLETLCSFFDAVSTKKIMNENGKPDVIVASSVFTHMEDPGSFLTDARELLAENGKLIIEVEYIVNIIRNFQFERFYLDRIYYYSVNSLSRLFGSHGFKITSVEMIEPHGGSIRVTGHHEANSIEPEASVALMLDEEKNILTTEVFSKFQNEIVIYSKELVELLQVLKVENTSVAGYGAPARLSTICNFAGIGPDLIPFTVDDSPLKQGRFTPGTHIPVVDRERLSRDNIEMLIVFAYEYIQDIRVKTNNAYKYFMPIPPREI